MQRDVKGSLLLLALLFALVLSMSFTFAQDVDDSGNLAVYNDNETISIEGQDDGYDEVSVVSDENEDSYADDGISVESNDDKLQYVQPNPAAYIQFDQEDFTITEGESVTITGAFVDSTGNDPGGNDFPLAVYVNNKFTKYAFLSNHRFSVTIPDTSLIASETPYKVLFNFEDGPEYSGEYLEGYGGPEGSDSWVFITVNSNTPQPVTLSEAYVDYANGLDTNAGTSVDAPFKTIEHALSVIEDNAVIYIADGVNYLDDVDVNGLNILNNVSIVGMGDNAVIDARNSGRIFKIQGNTVLLSNLIFMNGDVSSASDKRGAAVWANQTTLTIDNCKFINNTAGSTGSTYGAAVNLKATTTAIKDSYFEGNSAVYSGAVNAEKGNILLNVSNSIFTNNEVYNTGNYAVGGGICAYGETIVDRSTFYGNKVTKDANGRSIKQYDGHLTVTNSIILDGLGAINIKDPANATLANNWWGQNDTTKDSTPKELNLTNAEVDSYLYLSLSTAATTLEVGKPITIDVKFISQDTVNLVNVPATVSSGDGTFDNDELTLVNGNGHVQFTSNKIGENSISVDVLGITDTIELTFEEAYDVGQLVDKFVEIDSGVVSGGVQYVALNPWTVTGTLNYVIPQGVTNIKSVIVIINSYSGSGSQSYGLYSNVTLNTANGLEVLAFDSLRMDGFPAFTNDPNVYGVNKHTTRQYSDYQLLFDITDKVKNLNPGDDITIGVQNTKISDLQFDGRIKLISLFFAYDDGDEDNFTYWLNAGQLWTQGSDSFSFDTSDYSGKVNNISITSVGLSSELAKLFKINNVGTTPASIVSGNYYKYMVWDNMAPMFNQGQDTSFFFTCSDQGLYVPSYKANVALLVATELANEPVLTEVYVDYDNGSDSYLGTTASAPFKTIEHALNVVGDDAIIHIADGVHYLDGVDVNGLNILKNVSIVGMGDNAVIDARNSGRIFKIQGNTVLLSNLIFVNGDVSGASDKRGAAVWANQTTLTIDNCKFINNTAGSTGSTYGAAVNLKATTTAIKDSYFEGNSAVYSGAVNAEKGNILLNVSNSVFINNEVYNTGNYAVGGGICAYGETIVDRSTFYGNKVTKDANGRSIKQYDGHLTVTNSIILDGLGAINIKDPANATLANNWWGQNDTTKDSTPKELNLTNAEVDSYLYLNLTMYSKGLNVGDVATVNINLFSSYGGNSYVIDLPVTVEAVNGNANPTSLTLVNGRDGEVEYTITEVGDNSVTVDILGVKETINLTSESVITTEVVYVDFANGSNAYSGDSWATAVKTLEKAVKLVENDGVIYVANGVTYLVDSTPATGIVINKNVKIIGQSLDAVISGNNAKRIFNVNNGYTLTISNLTLTEGYSTAQGGAIFVANGGKINISDSVISNSHANSAGGAIGSTQGYLNNINNVTFINNSAGNNGGAVGLSGGSATNSAITIGDNCKFINNTASNYGTAVGASSPPVTIGKNNLFEGNRATGSGKGTVASNKITLGTGNIFVNNKATVGGALFAALNSGSATGSYCFFINNTDNNGYTLGHYANTNTANNKFTLNDCYWGTNTPDFNSIFNRVFYHNTYLILDVSADKETIPYGQSAVVTIDLTKNQNGAEIDVNSLPELTFQITGVNGIVDPESVKLENGMASFTYTPIDEGEGSATANFYSVSETVDFTTTVPDVAITSVTTPWSQGIYPAVNNTFTVKITNNDGGAVEDLVVEVYSNETGELLMNYTIDSLASGTTSIALTDPTIRPLTEETVWPAAQNNKIRFTFNLKYMDKIISTNVVDKMLAYDGYLNQTYAYGSHNNTINRNYTVSGDIIIATQDVSVYADQFTRFRNETWNIETPEGAEIVKVFLYFNYNWDSSQFPNGWSLTFNDKDILNSYITFEKDRGNLGGYGAYDYGLLVFDVTEDYKANANNSFVINKTGNCALYPSTLFVLYNMTNSDTIKDVYFSDLCDVFYPYYNSVGYDDLLTANVHFDNIDLTNLDSATLYAFGGSGGYNDADLSFNNITVTNAYKDDNSEDCHAYELDVTSAISNDNLARFITSTRSSTVVAYQQVLVVSKKLTPTFISTDIVNGSEIFVGDDLSAVVVVDPVVNGTYSFWFDGVLLGEFIVVNGVSNFTVPGADLTVGDHNVSVQFNANGYYLASDKVTYDFTVSKVRDYNITADPVNTTYGEQVCISVTLPSDAEGGLVWVSIGGVNYTATVSGGEAVILGPSDLTPDNYEFTVTYTGDSKYDIASNNTKVSVSKAEIPVDDAMTITINGENVTVTIAMPESATGNLTVTVDGTITNTTALNGGIAEITLNNLTDGNHTLSVAYSGDDNYANLSKNTTVEIVTIQEVNLTAKYTVSVLDNGFTVTFVINTDPALNNENLTIKFNGKEYTVRVINGVANFTSKKVYANTYPTEISYVGSAVYANTSTTVNAIVKSTKITQLNTFTYYYYNNDMGSDSEKGISQIKVVDSDGKPIKKGLVTITIMNKYKLKVKTDANGIAKFTKAYKPGTYSVTAEHNNKVTKLGNLVLKSVVNVPKVTNIKKSAKTTTIKITLKGTGPIKGKTVVVSFMKKNYKVTTDKNGVALFKVTQKMVENLGVGKTYKIRVTYRMDSVAQSIKILK